MSDSLRELIEASEQARLRLIELGDWDHCTHWQIIRRLRKAIEAAKLETSTVEKQARPLSAYEAATMDL